jgi:hypothetical protein
MVNEEFLSLRHKIFTPEDPTDHGSHHAIWYSDFDAAVKKAGFNADYFVADHVRQKLTTRFSRTIANGVVAVAESFPPLLKQLNSALIVLKKSTVTKAHQASRSTATPVLQQ